jgi:hypothetical protein
LDTSAGKWRDLVYTSQSDFPAVQPQHEKRKYLAVGELWKFAGLGRYGSVKLQRARRLSDAGFTPRVIGLEHGFLRTEFVQGSPLRPADIDETTIQRIATYLSFLKVTFPIPGRVPYASLLHMIRINTGIECPESNAAIEEGELVALDGRMLPHEWIQTNSGLLKTDALDHHDDHFFPGSMDIAWDIAGAAIEFRMSSKQEEQLISDYLSLRSDSTLRRRLEFYRLAYLAYRIGYVVMAGQSLGQSEDARRFEDLHAYYAMALRRLTSR